MVEAIQILGFPIASAVGLAVFCAYMIKTTKEDMVKHVNDLQKSWTSREEKLYKEIQASRKVNSEAMEIIARLADRLDGIQQDISLIKTDVTIIKAKTE